VLMATWPDYRISWGPFWVCLGQKPKITPYQRSSGCNTRAACINAPNQALPAELLYGQSDHYVEYDRSGNIIKGAEKPVPRSKYEEDGT
jgi:hypothetical protein